MSINTRPCPWTKFGVHFAPDFDAVLAMAMLWVKYNLSFDFFVRFFPSGIMDETARSRLEADGFCFIDTGGGIFDHHGKAGYYSATQLVAEYIGWADEDWIQDVLAYTNSQDETGFNFFGSFANENSKHINLKRLLLTSVVKGSSDVRFNPITSGATSHDQANAFRQLVVMIGIWLSHLRNLNCQPLAISSKAVELSWKAFAVVAAKQCYTQLPKGSQERLSWIEKFSSLEEIINSINTRVGEGYDCREEPGLRPFMPIMAMTADQWNALEEPFATSLMYSVLALAEALAQSNYWYPAKKLSYLATAWENLQAWHSDELDAATHLRNGQVCFNRVICGKRVMAVESNSSQIGPLARKQKVDVVIVFRRWENGNLCQMQITCNSGDEALSRAIKRAGAKLRQQEARLRRLPSNLPFASEGTLVADWYIPEFGGAFNGSLTHPGVQPTKIPPREVTEIVCQAIQQEFAEAE